MIRTILAWLRRPITASTEADYAMPRPLTDLLHPNARCWNVEGEWKRHSFFLDGQPVPTCRRCGTTSPYLSRVAR